MSLNFLSGNTLDPRVTFSRGTNATLIDSTGQLTYAPSNQIPNSESFTATTWVPTGLAGTPVVSNATVAPDGTTTADSIVEVTGGAASDHRIDYSGLAGNAGKYAASVYLKAGTKTFARLQFDAVLNSVSSSAAVQINLTNGTPSSTSAVGNITAATATSEFVGNGWYRLGLIFTISPTYVLSGGSVRIFLMESLAPTPSYIGNGSNIFVWGAQFGAMTYETAPRAYNSTTPKNLLGFTEEFDNAAWTKSQAYIQTNLLTYSEQLDNAVWIPTNINPPTANATTAPNGTLTADKIVGNTTASGHIINQPGVLSATLGTLYTASVYVKAAGYNFAFIGLGGAAYSLLPYISVNLTDGSSFITNGTPSFTSVTNVGNGWYRVSISGATDVAASSVQIQIRPSPDGIWANRTNAQNDIDGIYAWGGQLVQGATAGNYQQTIAAAAAVQYADPNGYLNADKLVETTSTSTHHITQTTAFVSETVYTWDFFVKAAERSVVRVLFPAAAFTTNLAVNFDIATGAWRTSSPTPPAALTLFSQDAGNGWYRISVTAKATASVSSTILLMLVDSPSGTGSYTGDGTSGAYIWGAQLSDSASVDPYVYNPAAALTSTAYYGPRFEYDPNYVYSTNNLIPYANPQDFSNNSFWTKARATAPATTATADPAGTYTAYKLTEDTTPTTSHLIQWQGVNTGVITGAQYTFSGYAKAAERTAILVAIGPDNGAFTTNGGTIDITPSSSGGTGAVSGTTGAAPIVTDAGNGWWRWSITATATASALCVVRHQLIAGGTNSYTGDGVSGVYIWGAQLVTGAAPVPFYYYPYTPLGLLIEEARTNLMFPSYAATGWSASPVGSVVATANAATSPDGTTNATKLATGNTASNGHVWYKTYTGAINTAYCGSAYFKAGEYTRAQMAFDNSSFATATGALFDLAAGSVVATGGGSTATITPVGNGWYRCSITATSVGTVGNYVVSLSPVPSSVTTFNAVYVPASTGLGIYVYGSQVEAASFATSFIPTVAASATRSADVATMVGNNFSNWYNQNNGTISASADTVAPNGSSSAILSFQDAAGTATNRHQLSFYTLCSATVLSGTVQANLGENTLQSLKSAYAYQNNNFAFSANGTTAVVDPSGTVPLTIGYATLGRWDFGAVPSLNGHLKYISYYNTRLPNTQLQVLTL
jgi:hypothetical protein